MINPGDIGYSNDNSWWFPALIRFFTKSSISHSFVICKPFCGEESVQEAEEVIQVVPFNKYYREGTQQYWIYHIKNIDQSIKDTALDSVYKEFAGSKYGYLQCIWFIYRWFFGLFGKDVRHEKNWMTDGVICSELQCYYLIYIGLGELVKDFNPDTIQAQDLLSIIQQHPEIFELVEVKE